MARERFRFDNETLSFKKIEVTIKQRLLKGLGIGAASLVFGFILTILAYNFIDSPKEKDLRREINQLTYQYGLLNKKMTSAETVLSDLENRDDNIYRVIFEAEPIDDNIRQAGVGGINNYKKLQGYDNSGIMVETEKRLDKILKKSYVQSKSYDEIVELVKKQAEMLAAIPAIQPVANTDLKRMASGFGFRVHPIYKARKFHAGMDFTASTGTEVYATGNGTVVKSESGGGFGQHIVIEHGYGYETLYAHLSSYKVRAGDKVKRGDVIGLVGNTGRSTGPHLHYEVHKNGETVNPVNFYYNDLSPDEYDQMLDISSQSNQSFD